MLFEMIPMRLLALVGGLLLCACSMIPEMPGDESLPLAEIVLNSSCELRQAFLQLDAMKLSSFAAKQWQIGITITPKIDKELTAGFGLTGKITTNAKRLYFTNWAIGGPGLQYDTRGTKNGQLVYNIKSSDLLDVKNFPLNCDVQTKTYSLLNNNLGIRDWIVRGVLAQEQSVGNLATFDKPTYTAEIFVKFSGNGTYTYNFPFGTDFASLSGSYDMDESLSIALTSTPKATVIVATTLPGGGVFGKERSTTITTSTAVAAPTQLDTLQSQQNIINAINSLRLQQ
jgi:hypothetical protein